MRIRGHDFVARNEIEQIHEATVEVLTQVGVKFNHKEALAVFKKHGARIEGNTVYISENMLENALASVPSHFVLQGRESAKNITVGGEKTVFAPAYGPVYVLEGKKRRFATTSDFINFTKLTEVSELLNLVNSNLLEPQDIPHENRKMNQIINCLKYSTKPLIGMTASRSVAEQTIDLVTDFYGIEKGYCVLGVISPASPLIYDSTMLEAIFVYGEKHQPLLFSSCSLPGATSPVSIAGSLVVNNAELLAGIVLAQLISPGLPVIYGITTPSCDLRYVSPAIGSAETGIITCATSALSNFYGMPSRSGGSLSDSKVLDMQAGIESAFTVLPTIIAEINFVLHSCGIMESFNSISYEKFIIDEEVIQMAERFASGFEINEELLGVEVIKKCGPGGHFLEKNHTMKHFRDEHYVPSLFSREGYDAWVKNGLQILCDKAKVEIEKRLKKYKIPYLTSKQRKLISSYIPEDL